MPGPKQITALFTGRVLLDRVQANIVGPMNTVLRSLPQSVHFQFVEVSGVNGAFPTYALQYLSGGNVWVTVDTFDTAGNLTANGLAVSGGSLQPSTDGKKAQAGQVFMGSGVPAAGNGANGDVYFRTDVPGTANQRVYQKAAGAWAGVL